MSQQATSQTTWQAPPGHLGNLSPEQQQTLEQFRKALSSDPNFPWTPARHTDSYLLRFLRARKFNLELSKQMIYAAEQWRKDFGVDEIVRLVILFLNRVHRTRYHLTTRLLHLRSYRSHNSTFANAYHPCSYSHPESLDEEKKEVNKLYPQYYHKIDKVSHSPLLFLVLY
jgi:hypothetical protein